MELSQIRYFMEVARSQHMTKSAKKLHIAQPALSQSVRRLEKELGVELFAPRGRNIALTPCGEYLMNRLEPVIQVLDGLPDELEGVKDSESATVRISVLAASTLVTQAIIDYKRKNPNIRFHVVQGESDEMSDIEIKTSPRCGHGEAENRFVCTERIFLAVPDNEKYRGMKSISLARASGEGFISLMGSKQLRSICDSFCRHAGFEPKVIFESDNQTAVKNMIGANLGVGFWPGFTWGELESDHVRLLEITEPDCRRDIIITYRSGKINRAAAREFYKFLITYFRRGD